MSKYKYLLRLLKPLEEAVPPNPSCHHAIIRSQYGSEEDGWSETLILQLSIPSGLWKVRFEEDDFKKPIKVLIEEIVMLLPILVDPAQFDIACRLEDEESLSD